MALGPQSYQIVIFSWIWFAIATFCVVARIYVQLYFRVRPWREIFVGMAWLCSLGSVICTSLQNHYGFFDQDHPLTLEKYYKGMRVVFSITLLYYPSLGFCKMALLCFFGDLTPRKHCPKTWWTIAFAWFLVVGGSVLQIIATLSLCSPLQTDFGRYNPGCSFRIVTTVADAYTANHLLTDILAFAIPFVILRNLGITARSARPTYIMFAVGAVNIASAFVIFFNSEIVNITLSGGGRKVRATMDAMSYLLILQLYTAVIIVCMPQVRRLWMGLSAESLRPELRAARRMQDRSVGPTDVEASGAVAGPGMVAAPVVVESGIQTELKSPEKTRIAEYAHERNGSTSSDVSFFHE